MRTTSKTSKLPKARETPRSTRVFFNFASDWLREWRQFSRPITERSKAKTKQRLITFDTHLINLHFRLLITKYTLCNEIAMESEVCSTISFLLKLILL